MNRWPVLTVLLSIISMLTACASHPRVYSDFDKSRDFSRYRTYNFQNAAELADPDFHELLGLTFSAAVEQQLLSRGYVKSENPDILIDVATDFEDKTRAPGPAYGCPSYTTANSAAANATVIAGKTRGMYCRYTEGPVKIVMLDARQNQIVWEGVSMVRVDERERGLLLNTFIVQDVRRMFEGAPFNPVRPPEWFIENHRITVN